MVVGSFVKKIFGSRNERQIKKYYRVVEKINALETSLSELSDQQLKEKTAFFKKRLSEKEALESLLPEAFAVVREAGKRTLNMRHFDVQLIGGMVLHEGKIAEMKTGEGKTLVATLPAYLNALKGDAVHIVTVNDYLAQRDADWMRPLYEFLGLSVGVIVHGLEKEHKKAVYACDVVYGTNNEFGFDYLRDNMAFAKSEIMQSKLAFAIVDEVDSILIDEARTPLIISGADEDSSQLYQQINRLIPALKKQPEKEAPGDYSIDEKNKQAYLTEAGHEKIESLLVGEKLLKSGESLYDPSNIMLMHHVNAALKAHTLFRKDVDYIVKDHKIVIVDEHTGRTMEGRRWSEGLHQAVEAKENVPIENENQTLASITFQNFFRLYEKLAGMTGTADTEAYEFQQIYGLEVMVIPTNKPLLRKDGSDLIYLTQKDKFEAIIEDIQECLVRKQPVLVGTISIETSEYLSMLLKKRNIAHQVLNAKFHEKEAEIVAEAGRPGGVTIATNMAGRGTDIVLGGCLEVELKNLAPEKDSTTIRKDWQMRHQAVLEAGGLRIIGTERHESRRIDNQLRGRSARQGDPGSTQFYLSLEDNLMRIFISDRISGFLNKLGLEKGEAITHPWITRAVENAQRKVEGHNFDIRKQLLEFDNVANDQRKVIYQQRSELLQAESIQKSLEQIRVEVIESVIREHIPQHSLEAQWEILLLEKALQEEFGLKLPIHTWLETDSALEEEGLIEKIKTEFESAYQKKQAKIGIELFAQLEKSIMLNVLDTQWKEHLGLMDYLRHSINLRGYAQQDPKQEYKREAFLLFSQMLEGIKKEVISILYLIELQEQEDIEKIETQMRNQPKQLSFEHDTIAPIGTDANQRGIEDQLAQEFTHEQQSGITQSSLPSNAPKIGRNAPCPCGSGRKYKQCHGKIA